ncbi:caspase-like isoform X2 [Anopheles aquasalis]|uniref:caspase-like isoform X2 n=1 Tax=Anopheles aquasalis TaxID=42839 RepID=UPI00215AC4B1|nr:caspase-like isoform X2 [Anopheles aquasalis]
MKLISKCLDIFCRTKPTQGEDEPLRQSTVATSIPVHALSANPDLEYSTKNKNRGVAIVINQEKFSTMKSREGSSKDRDDICAVLASLEFEVRVLNDFKRSALIKKLEEIASEDHTHNDCLVVVVMTHGEQGVLFAADAEYKVDRLWECFIGEACPTLLGKPKLFFIQACRGKKLDEGVLVRSATDTVDARESPKQHIYTIPTTADLLVMYSTYDGHYSWRNPTNGSWFIQSLCTVLKSYGREKELLPILTAVSWNVAYNYRSFVPDNAKMDAMKQMPCIVSMLTKAVYFRPKSVS